MDLPNLCSLSLLLVYILPLLLYIINHQLIHLIAVAGAVGTASLSEFIKYALIKGASPRPKGASDCNLWCNDGKQEGNPGMPSGHSSTVTFFSAFYYQQTTNPWIRAGLVLYALLVMWSRYEKKCHSVNQIVSGSLLGLFTGWLLVRMM
jgi:membrane-associated phospholipid phosphatase